MVRGPVAPTPPRMVSAVGVPRAVTSDLQSDLTGSANQPHVGEHMKAEDTDPLAGLSPNPDVGDSTNLPPALPSLPIQKGGKLSGTEGTAGGSKTARSIRVADPGTTRSLRLRLQEPQQRRKVPESAWRFFQGDGLQLASTARLPSLRADTPTAEVEMKAMLARAQLQQQRGGVANNQRADSERENQTSAAAGEGQAGEVESSGVVPLPPISGGSRSGRVSSITANRSVTPTRGGHRVISADAPPPVQHHPIKVGSNAPVVNVTAEKRIAKIAMSRKQSAVAPSAEPEDSYEGMNFVGGSSRKPVNVVPSSNPSPIFPHRTPHRTPAGTPRSLSPSLRQSAQVPIPAPPPVSTSVRPALPHSAVRGYTDIRHNPPNQGSLLPIERPREKLLPNTEELLSRVRPELVNARSAGLLRGIEVAQSVALPSGGTSGDNLNLGLHPGVEPESTRGRLAEQRRRSRPSSQGSGGTRPSSQLSAAASPVVGQHEVSGELSDSPGADLLRLDTTIDMSVTTYRHLEIKTQQCIDVFTSMVPLGKDEKLADELNLDTKARLRLQYRSMHPTESVVVASNVPEEIANIITSTRMGVPVSLSHEGAETRAPAAAPPRKLDHVTLDTFHGVLLPKDSDMETREERIARLRAKQAWAEEALGIHNPAASVQPPPLITDEELGRRRTDGPGGNLYGSFGGYSSSSMDEDLSPLRRLFGDNDKGLSFGKKRRGRKGSRRGTVRGHRDKGGKPRQRKFM